MCDEGDYDFLLREINDITNASSHYCLVIWAMWRMIPHFFRESRTLASDIAAILGILQGAVM
jgi:hypothetical protein